jgi:hypothetical protein
MGKVRERQIILKTVHRTVLLELDLGGKFQAKSSGWDENRTFFEGDVLGVAVRKGRWVAGAEMPTASRKGFLRFAFAGFPRGVVSKFANPTSSLVWANLHCHA